MEEEFRDIKGYEGLYQVSNLGRVKSLKSKKGKILKGGVHGQGYITVGLVKDDYKTKKIHRLVALSFIPNPENKPCVNHKKGIKADNRASELEWVTYKENTAHAIRTGLLNYTRGDLKSISLSIPQRLWDDLMDLKHKNGFQFMNQFMNHIFQEYVEKEEKK